MTRTDTGRVVVVGAGGLGGWTALALRRIGFEVVLVDAWGPGNPRSSSGGETRVIRAIYGPDRVYVEMVQRSFRLWEALDAATPGEELLVRSGVLWLLRRAGHPYVESSLPLLAESGFPVERPSLEEARRRWPAIDLTGVEALLVETRAGILAARAASRAVRERFLAEGGVYRTAVVEPPAGDDVRVPRIGSSDGPLAADAFVFACGPWLGRLFPAEIGDGIRASRQDVFYFGAPAGVDVSPDRLPVWIDFGDPARMFYGFPDVHGRGLKVADDTRGPEIDPTSLDRTPDPAALERARAFLAVRFPSLADAPLLESRVCQYENSPEGDLVVGLLPGRSNVWVVGGGSGHGFKLAPALGESVARAISEGEPLPERFSPVRLTSAARSGTQFDRGS